MARQIAIIQNKTADPDRRIAADLTDAHELIAAKDQRIFAAWSRQATKGMVSCSCHSVGESRSRNCSAIQSMNTRRRGDSCRVWE